MKYAVIENNKVTNVVVSDSPLEANWVQSDIAKIGDNYDGENFTTPPLYTTQEELKNACERAINELIQSKIEEYNTQTNLALKDIYSCAHYALVDGYSHQPFCQAVWAWNVDVWETARLRLAEALAGEITITSPEEALALLPEFVFTG